MAASICSPGRRGTGPCCLLPSLSFVRPIFICLWIFCCELSIRHHRCILAKCLRRLHCRHARSLKRLHPRRYGQFLRHWQEPRHVRYFQFPRHWQEPGHRRHFQFPRHSQEPRHHRHFLLSRHWREPRHQRYIRFPTLQWPNSLDIVRLHVLFKNSKANTGLWQMILFSYGVSRSDRFSKVASAARMTSHQRN